VKPAARRYHALVERFGIAALIAVTLAAASTNLPVLNVLQGWISDASVAVRVAIFGARPLDSEHVLIVGMDARTLDAPELKTQPQAMFTPAYAELAHKVFDHGGRGLIFDVIMLYDAKDLTLNGEKPLKRYDDAFLKTLLAERRLGRLVLGWSSGLLPARRFALTAGRKGLGLVETPFGTGSVIRSVPTRLVDTQGKPHITLSGRALALFGVEAPPAVSILPPASISTLPAVSMIDIVRCDDPERLRELLDGRMVFVGGLLPGQDRLKTPDLMIRRGEVPVASIDPGDRTVACDFNRPRIRTADQPTVPGVFIHAAAVDAVMSGWQVQRAGPWARLGVVLVTSFLAVFFAFVLRTALAAAGMISLVAAAFFAAVAALEAGYFLPVSWAVAVAPVGFLGGYGLRLRLLDRKSNLIRQEFGRYLSPVLVEQMVVSGQMPELGGEERDVTVMFADLTGFTAASERLGSEELMTVLNRYLDAVAGVIRDRDGYVDKFIGDAVMAIFNAPAPLDDHSAEAVRAAHEICRLVAAMEAEDTELGRQGFAIKIGISSGPATVGNVGSRDRVNYTVVGETVNLAARFEGLPSLFRTPIVIGPVAAERNADTCPLLRLASIQVKGKSEGVDIYAPLDAGPGEGKAIAALIDRYSAALAAFENGSFDVAAAGWDKLAMLDWPGAGPSAAMAEEASRLGDHARPPDWNGVLQTETRLG